MHNAVIPLKNKAKRPKKEHPLTQIQQQIRKKKTKTNKPYNGKLQTAVLIVIVTNIKKQTRKKILLFILKKKCSIIQYNISPIHVLPFLFFYFFNFLFFTTFCMCMPIFINIFCRLAFNFSTFFSCS